MYVGHMQEKKSREIRREKQYLEAELRCPRKTDRKIMTEIKKKRTGGLPRWKMGWADKEAGLWKRASML